MTDEARLALIPIEGIPLRREIPRTETCQAVRAAVPRTTEQAQATIAEIAVLLMRDMTQETRIRTVEGTITDLRAMTILLDHLLPTRTASTIIREIETTDHPVEQWSELRLISQVLEILQQLQQVCLLDLVQDLISRNHLFKAFNFANLLQ